MFLRCAVQEHERTASHLASSSLGTWMCVSGGGAYCSHLLSIPQQPHRIPTLFTHPPGPQSPIHFSFFLDFPSFSILCLRTLPSPASLETLQVSCFAGFFPLTSALGSGESGEVQIRKVEKERRDLDSGIPIDYSPPLSEPWVFKLFTSRLSVEISRFYTAVLAGECLSPPDLCSVVS